MTLYYTVSRAFLPNDILFHPTATSGCTSVTDGIQTDRLCCGNMVSQWAESLSLMLPKILLHPVILGLRLKAKILGIFIYLLFADWLMDCFVDLFIDSLIHLCHKVESVDVNEEHEVVQNVKRNDVSSRNYCCLLLYFELCIAVFICLFVCWFNWLFDLFTYVLLCFTRLSCVMSKKNMRKFKMM